MGAQSSTLQQRHWFKDHRGFSFKRVPDTDESRLCTKLEQKFSRKVWVDTSDLRSRPWRDGEPLRCATGASNEPENDTHEDCTAADSAVPWNINAVLPKDMLEQCLARSHRSDWPVIRQVCRSWCEVLGGQSLFTTREEIGRAEEWLYAVEWIQGPWPHGRLWVYDPQGAKWKGGKKLPSMQGISQASSMVALGQYLYFLGGAAYERRQSNGRRICTPEDFVWRFDTFTGRITQMASMRIPRFGFATCVINGRLVVAGGSGSLEISLKSAEIYDPKRNIWEPLPDMAVPRRKCFGALLDGQVYVLSNTMVRSSEACSADVYDTAVGEWRRVERAVPSDLGGPLSTKFTTLGGRLSLTNHVVFASHEVRIYNKNENEWHTIARLPVGCFHGFGVVGMRNKLYVEGGSEEPSGRSSVLWQPVLSLETQVEKRVGKQKTPYMHIFDPCPTKGSSTWQLGVPPSDNSIARSCSMCAVMRL